MDSQEERNGHKPSQISFVNCPDLKYMYTDVCTKMCVKVSFFIREKSNMSKVYIRKEIL